LFALISSQVSEVFNKFTIYYHSKHEEFVWKPIDGALGDICQSYRVVTRDNRYENDTNFNRAIIYSQLVSEKDTAWLSLNPIIFRKLTTFISSTDLIDVYVSCLSLSTVKQPIITEEVKKKDYIISIAQEHVTTSKQSNKKIFSQTLDGYIDWLNNGIETGEILINQRGARFHVVNEGLLLAAPFAFFDYEKKSGIPWKVVQNTLLRKRWHLRNSNNQNFISYLVTGKKDKKIINGVVIKNPSHLLKNRIPQPSPYLKPVQPS
jgi:hypothetical protein